MHNGITIGSGISNHAQNIMLQMVLIIGDCDSVTVVLHRSIVLHLVPWQDSVTVMPDQAIVLHLVPDQVILLQIVTVPRA